MNSDTGREVTLSLRFATVPIHADGLSNVSCLNCEKPLDIHQPDAELPDRMLATCESCKRWHLVDCNLNAAEAAVVLLPTTGLFREVLGN